MWQHPFRTEGIAWKAHLAGGQDLVRSLVVIAVCEGRGPSDSERKSGKAVHIALPPGPAWLGVTKETLDTCS